MSGLHKVIEFENGICEHLAVHGCMPRTTTQHRRFEAEVVPVAGVEASVPADPDDNHMLATLIAGKTDRLITGDSDFDGLAGQYPIISPGEFVRRFL